MVIGVGVAFIGYQQFRVAKHKLKLDLYEKRWSIYNAMRGLLVATYKSSDEIQIATLKAYEKKAEARFLLDNAACIYIDKLLNTITDFNNLNGLQKSDKTRDSSTDYIKLDVAQGERTRWLVEQYEPLIAEFSRFLHVDHNL